MHTLDLPDANLTTDAQVLVRADRDQRVVGNKDADFAESHLLNSLPARWLLISAGNIRTRDRETFLVPLSLDNFAVIDFLELGRSGLVIRE